MSGFSVNPSVFTSIIAKRPDSYGVAGKAAADMISKLGSNTKLVKGVDIIENRSDPPVIKLTCAVDQSTQLRAALEKAGAEVSRNNLPTEPFRITYKFEKKSFQVSIREDRPTAVMASI